MNGRVVSAWRLRRFCQSEGPLKLRWLVGGSSHDVRLWPRCDPPEGVGQRPPGRGWGLSPNQSWRLAAGPQAKAESWGGGVLEEVGRR